MPELTDEDILRVRNLVADSKSATTFGKDLIQAFNAKCADESVTLAQALHGLHRLQNFTVTISAPMAVVLPLLTPLVGVELKLNIVTLIINGNIPSAYAMLRLFQADDMGQTYHLWSSERLEWIRAEIATYLGI